MYSTFANIDLSAPNPIPAILASPEYREAVRTYLEEKRSMSPFFSRSHLTTILSAFALPACFFLCDAKHVELLKLG